eukprot:TRINITY_DN8557_c0_g1_i1.p1 TRINITY_DN8557_c0_g1~~TRINITY_DN8557_c0_g1_i1.p1  ORF type:complete len:585 (+),score=96.55 TRINITY_DN8557_c0_g1_i1:184-1755(+)
MDEDEDGVLDFLQMVDDFDGIWAGYTSILGFLVVFRNSQAYSRFWEGATLVRQVRGEWFNAISALIAFSSHHVSEEAAKVKQDDFKQTLVRLASALYCSALRQVCDLDESTLQVLDLRAFNSKILLQLEEAEDRCQLIILWLQRLIIKAEKEGVLAVPSPILSRSFQELSRGTVNLSNLRKLKEVPFPFPYQQMLIIMLLGHNVMTTMLSVALVRSLFWSTAVTFMVVGSFWAVIYIAVEIDQPFGDDPNDLPLVEMQKEFNNDLVALLAHSEEDLPSLEQDVKRKPSGRAKIKHHSVLDLASRVDLDDISDDDDDDEEEEEGGENEAGANETQADTAIGESAPREADKKSEGSSLPPAPALTVDTSAFQQDFFQRTHSGPPSPVYGESGSGAPSRGARSSIRKSFRHGRSQSSTNLDDRPAERAPHSDFHDLEQATDLAALFREIHDAEGTAAGGNGIRRSRRKSQSHGQRRESISHAEAGAGSRQSIRSGTDGSSAGGSRDFDQSKADHLEAKPKARVVRV